MRILKTLFVLMCVLLLTSSCKVSTEPGNAKDTFSARITQVSGTLTGRLTLTVEKWTTPEERDQLFMVLQKDGSDALVKELRKKKVGYFRLARTTAESINFAISRQTEKGLLIRLVAARPIHFGEFKAHTQSQQYEFGFIEFLLDEKGKGEGRILPAVKIGINKNGLLNIESLGFEPLKLINVIKK